MSTLKKNKRIKLAKQLEIYGDLKPTTGNSITRRGKAKYLGGNGRKTTGISRRVFKKNLQCVRVQEDGIVVRRRVPVSLLRSGLVLKPIVREPFTIDEPIRSETPKKGEAKKGDKKPEAKKAEAKTKKAEPKKK
ncbi:50S ribosomal protein L28 [Caulifigura coniformis]|uniref:50S ribosomal protein L28 n=1 Tax=Caulifigura coniformis TaxID=2527983 RepID=A0A517SLR0_9PLAN|nr:L28 family ribosomal protein [Caulifigura coniformis]QDT57062.1 50S ribosomal protein L28 [Caulifigura coniformis]